MFFCAAAWTLWREFLAMLFLFQGLKTDVITVNAATWIFFDISTAFGQLFEKRVVSEVIVDVDP